MPAENQSVLWAPGALDANSILSPLLWQGTLPHKPQTLRTVGFEVLVFCAGVNPVAYFTGFETLHAPNVDDGSPLTLERWETAQAAGKWVADRILEGKKVLVTCQAGLNRSGLVSALAIHYLTGAKGSVCCNHVRICRPLALSNRAFQKALYALGPRTGSSEAARFLSMLHPEMPWK